MKKLCVLFALLVGVTLSGGNVFIAENGKAQADIVIPAKPSVYVKFAAEELKQYLDKITGADFKIVSTPISPARIYLGQCEAAVTAGLKPETLKRDGFFISAKGNNIFIVGQDNSSEKRLDLFHLFYDESRRGTLLGVYDFLEQLGVRWPAPGPEHEFVPKSVILKIPEGTQKIEPFFQDRQLTGFWDFLKRFPDAKEYCLNGNDIFLWGLRLKLSGRGMVLGCHSERSLKLKKIWNEQSKHFALINGKRNSDYTCWTDPAVAEMWGKVADAYFSGKKPSEVGFSHLKPYIRSFWPCPFITQDDFMIDPMDHGSGCDGRCRCKRCNEFREKYPCDDDSEIIWKVITKVAESIKKKHPDKFISTLVYPPKMKLPKYVKIPDNVRVRICIKGPLEMPTPNRMKSELNLVTIWSNALGGNKPPLWAYQCEAAHGRKLPGVPEIYPRLISEFLKIFRNDIAGMFFEQHALTHTYRNLDSYITARLLWNPDRNIGKELSEYFNAYYGPAAEPAKKLFKRFEDNWVKYWKLATPDKPNTESIGLGAPDKELQKLVWSKVYTLKEMQNIDNILKETEKASKMSPVHSKRVKLLRTWIFNIMKAERAEVMDKAEQRQKIIALVPIVKTAPTASDWAKAPVYSLIPANRFKKSLTAGGQFQMTHHGNTMYLRAELKEPCLTDSLTKKDRKSGDTKVWKDNDLEIFFYSPKKKDLWQIIVNDQGVWSSQRINTKSAKWLQLDKFKVNVQPFAGGWLVEAAIPLEQFGAGELRFNLTRNRQIKGQANELSTWSPLAKVGNWHDPENYGTIVFAEK